MIINIKPIYMKNLHCLENIFVTIATWLNRDFNPIFAFSWSFVLLPPVDDMNIFGYRIALGRMGSWRVLEQDDLFEKYCGVGLHWEVKGSPTELFKYSSGSSKTRFAQTMLSLSSSY